MPRVLTGREDLYVSKNGNSPNISINDIVNYLYVALPETGFFFSGKPTSSQVIAGYIADGPYRLPAGLPLSQAKLTVAATASTVCNIQKNGSNIGTVTFGAGATTGTFSFTNVVTFVAGDTFTIVAPASADTTAANFMFTIVPQQA